MNTANTDHKDANESVDGCTCKDCVLLRRYEFEAHEEAYEAEAALYANANPWTVTS